MMKAFALPASLALALTLAAPAFSALTPSPVVGKWQTPPDANGTATIIVFRPDGRATVSWHRGSDVERYTFFNGKPLFLQYTVSGDKLTITYPNHKVNEYEFTVTPTTLTYTKVLIFQSQPNMNTQIAGSTMTRFNH